MKLGTTPAVGKSVMSSVSGSSGQHQRGPGLGQAQFELALVLDVIVLERGGEQARGYRIRRGCGRGAVMMVTEMVSRVQGNSKPQVYG